MDPTYRLHVERFARRDQDLFGRIWPRGKTKGARARARSAGVAPHRRSGGRGARPPAGDDIVEKTSKYAIFDEFDPPSRHSFGVVA
ncbi:unannotated protein [freshwater metagenome]|uniref:Unannotated protein n=1 Tax=freshwater metagenome TaxID=449393 RepID=A0A6J7N0D1_9ZZZZ